jgi:hypothetical protein
MAVSVPPMAAVLALFSRCRNLCKAPHEVRRGAAARRDARWERATGPAKRPLPSVSFYIIIKTI